jgi:hypothetical protein
VDAGSTADVELHGAATCRGYKKAFQMLEGAAEPDDAYQLGQDPRTGFRVAIGHQKAVAARVRELHGEDVAWIMPDEVAAIVSSAAFEPVAAIKRLFLGAEIHDIRPRDPAKSDDYMC